MKTPSYRLSFEQTNVSRAGNGPGDLSPEHLYPSAAAILRTAPLSAGLYPASLPGAKSRYEENIPVRSDDTSESPFFEAKTRNAETVTRAEIRDMIDERLGSLRIYVLESDITQAQQAVKSVVELASF